MLTCNVSRADSGSGTNVTYELTIGLRLPMLGMLKRRAEKTIIDTALKGLKSRAESGGGAANRRQPNVDRW